jgi:hypothetical protein
MWRMKCPKCGRPIKWWPDDLFQPTCDKKKCVHCSEVLELSNPGVCSVINGLIFWGVFLALGFVGLRWQWLRALAAGFVCWFVHPFIVQLLGRWSSHAYRAEDLGIARVWAIVSAASWWVFGIAVAFTAIGFGLSYRALLASLSSWEGAIESQAIEDFTSTIKSWLPIGVGVALVAFVLAKVAAIRKSQLRNDQLQEGTK